MQKRISQVSGRAIMARILYKVVPGKYPQHRKRAIFEKLMAGHDPADVVQHGFYCLHICDRLLVNRTKISPVPKLPAGAKRGPEIDHYHPAK